MTTIALTFHWNAGLVPETRWAFPHYDRALPALVAAAPGRAWRLLGHGHPRAWTALERRWRALGVEPVPDLADVLDRADLLVGDNTSALAEFASTGRPVVWLNAPWYRRDVHHGGRFWTWPAGQVQVDEPGDLEAGIVRALADPADVSRARDAMVRSIYGFTDGAAATRAAAAITELLAQPLSAERHSLPAMGRKRVANERKSDLDTIVVRLHRLGASPGEIKAVIDTWDTFDDEWTPERRAEVVRSSDRVLLDMLRERRDEYPYEPPAPDLRPEQAAGEVVIGIEPPAPPPPVRRRRGAGSRPAPGARG